MPTERKQSLTVTIIQPSFVIDGVVTEELSAEAVITFGTWYKGDKGDDGKSAYEIWLEQGHTGTEEDFLEWLQSNVNDGVLTLQKNGTTIGTFSANEESDKTVDIDVPDSLSDMSDVDIASLQEGQVLKYNTATGKWENSTISLDGGILIVYFTYESDVLSCDTSIEDIFTAIRQGKMVYGDDINDNRYPLYAYAETRQHMSVYFGTTEGAKQVIFHGLSTYPDLEEGWDYTENLLSLDALSDVTIEETPDDGQVLTYDSVDEKWKPATPNEPNDGLLTIQRNEVLLGYFSANTRKDSTINIEVPETAKEVNALPDSTKYASSISLTLDDDYTVADLPRGANPSALGLYERSGTAPNYVYTLTTDIHIVSRKKYYYAPTWKITAQLFDQDNVEIGQSQVIDLPLESVVVDGYFDAQNQSLVLVLESGNSITVPVGALVSGLQTEITSQNPLSADLLADGTTNKVFTATEQSKLSGIEAGAEVNVKPDWNAASGSDAEILNKPTIPIVGTLKTNNSTAQSTSSSEPFSGTINLHKVSKTGSYNDLLNRPNITDTLPTVVCRGWESEHLLGDCTNYTSNKAGYLIIHLWEDNTTKDLLILSISGEYEYNIYINDDVSSDINYDLPRGIYIVYFDPDTGYHFRTDGKIPMVSGNGFGGSYNDLVDKPTIPVITGKADKVSGATNGNLAGLDSNGNLTDSGVAKGILDKMPSTLGTAGQIPKVNSGATAIEWGEIPAIPNGTYIDIANSGWGPNQVTGAFLRAAYFYNGEVPTKVGDYVYSKSTRCLHKITSITQSGGENVANADFIAFFSGFDGNYNNLSNKPAAIPTPTSADENKLLSVDSNGDYTLVTILNSENIPY